MLIRVLNSGCLFWNIFFIWVYVMLQVSSVTLNAITSDQWSSYRSINFYSQNKVQPLCGMPEYIRAHYQLREKVLGKVVELLQRDETQEEASVSPPLMSNILENIPHFHQSVHQQILSLLGDQEPKPLNYKALQQELQQIYKTCFRENGIDETISTHADGGSNTEQQSGRVMCTVKYVVCKCAVTDLFQGTESAALDNVTISVNRSPFSSPSHGGGENNELERTMEGNAHPTDYKEEAYFCYNFQDFYSERHKYLLTNHTALEESGCVALLAESNGYSL